MCARRRDNKSCREGARQEKQMRSRNDLSCPPGRWLLELDTTGVSSCLCSFNYSTILIGRYDVPGTGD